MKITVNNEVQSFFSSVESMNRTNLAYPLLSKSKILVVDEEIYNCETLDSMFMVMGMRDRSDKIEYAMSGMQALKAIFYAHTNSQEPYTFSLIIIECNMKQLSGFKTAWLIRNLYEILGVPPEQQPVIVGKADSKPDETMEKRAKQSGIDFVFPPLMPLHKFSEILYSLRYIDAVPEFLNEESSDE